MTGLRCLDKQAYFDIYAPRIKRLKQIGFEVSAFDPGASFFRIDDVRVNSDGKKVYGDWNSFRLEAKEWDLFDALLVMLLKTMSPAAVRKEFKKTILETERFVESARERIYRKPESAIHGSGPIKPLPAW